jgi:hypothetical protein
MAGNLYKNKLSGQSQGAIPATRNNFFRGIPGTNNTIPAQAASGAGPIRAQKNFRLTIKEDSGIKEWIEENAKHVARGRAEPEGSDHTPIIGSKGKPEESESPSQGHAHNRSKTDELKLPKIETEQ